MITIARIALFKQKPDGTLIGEKGETNRDTSINDMLRWESTYRIFEDITNAPNSAGNPTVEAYMVLEDAAGRNLVHMDHTTIVFQD